MEFWQYKASEGLSEGNVVEVTSLDELLEYSNEEGDSPSFTKGLVLSPMSEVTRKHLEQTGHDVSGVKYELITYDTYIE